MKKLFVLFTSLIIGQANGGEYQNVNGTNYWISHPLKGNYHQAYRNCAINGMYLVSIHTQQNFDTVMEAIRRFNSTYPEHMHFWTSGTCLGYPDKEFYWAETGYPITFSNWIDGHPTNQAKCMILTGGNVHKYRWSDQPCANSYQFICEDKINLPKVKGTECHFNQID